MSRDLEVAVVAGGRAEELDLALLAPGLVAANAVGVGVADQVVHQVEARRAVHDHVLGVDAQDLRGKGARGGQAVGGTVVVNGHALVVHLGGRVEDVEHGVRERGLLGAGLAARHVELEAQRAKTLGLGLEARDFLCEFLV